MVRSTTLRRHGLVAHPEQEKRIGDIRYSFFYWVDEMARPPWLRSIVG